MQQNSQNAVVILRHKRAASIKNKVKRLVAKQQKEAMLNDNNASRLQMKTFLEDVSHSGASTARGQTARSSLTR